MMIIMILMMTKLRHKIMTNKLWHENILINPDEIFPVLLTKSSEQINFQVVHWGEEAQPIFEKGICAGQIAGT